MKKLISLLLAVLLIASLSFTVFADLIYIPEDSFLNSHECQEVRRGFRAMTDVTIYESPESDTVEGTVPADRNTHVYYVYTDANGNEWGYTEFRVSEELVDGFLTSEYAYGWIPMAYMDLVYDHISFEEDYSHLFSQEDAVLDPQYAGQEIIFYTYPGSPTQQGSFTVGEYLPDFDVTYTDPDGRVWGYVIYYMGFRQCWVCINNPTADFDTLYPNGAPQVEITEPDETAPAVPAEEIKPAPSVTTNLLRFGIGAAVLACVAFTGVTLVRMKKKNEK